MHSGSGSEAGKISRSTCAEFVEAIEAGGVAAMEVLVGDLRALGLYTARARSFDGVEYELVEHALTPEQTRIYDACYDNMKHRLADLEM
jgi:hypothetical protein